MILGIGLVPSQPGYFIHPKKFPNRPHRSTSQPSAQSGQAKNAAPQVQLFFSGLAGSLMGKSFWQIFTNLNHSLDSNKQQGSVNSMEHSGGNTGQK